MTAWDIIEGLSVQQPVSRQSLESSFQLPMQEVEGNEDFRFFSARAGRFGEASVLSELELRVRRETNQAELVVANLNDSGITSAQARERFPDLKVTGIPRGRSPQEVVTLSRELANGRLSLCFKVHQQDRLSQIVFTPRIAG